MSRTSKVITPPRTIRNGINQQIPGHHWFSWYRGRPLGQSDTAEEATHKWVEAHRERLLNDERRRLRPILGLEWAPGSTVPAEAGGEDDDETDTGE